MQQGIRGVVVLCACLFSAATGAIEYKHAYAFLAEPKYPAGFQHFDYVNPNAPKGGSMRLAEMGNWDTFNRMPLTGYHAAGTDSYDQNRNLLYDHLLHQSLDEPAAAYGKLAEGVAVDADGRWIAFKLREGAYWHDGKPITTADVDFSFDVFLNKANPTIRQPLSFIDRVEVLNEREIRFWLIDASVGDAMAPLRIGYMPIFPQHYWATRDITKTTVEPPLGSGPYRIGDHDPGRWIRYERVDDYWGRNLAVNRGQSNFDWVKFDYFRDDQVRTESVKGYVVDIHEENLPRRWATTYDFPAIKNGIFRAETKRLTKPAGLWWPMFWNLDQKRFQDVRVREALWLCADFIWYNRRDYDFWDTATSFFHGSELAQRGLPSELELELLEPIRDKVPPRVFTEEFKPQPNSGSGWNRDNLVKAAALLEEAGWVVQDGELTHVETGEKFFIRFLAVSRALAGGFVPFTRVIEKLGIDSQRKAPEVSNWQYRMRAGDFDAAAIAFQPEMVPTREVISNFHSATADMEYSSNYVNMRDDAVDYLIEAMSQARTWEEFVAATRALDRVLLWNFYFIPGMSKVDFAYGWWDKYGIPDHERLNHHWAYLRIWWEDAEKARRVTEYRGR